MAKHKDMWPRLAAAIIILAVLFAGFFLLNPVTHAPTNEADLETRINVEPVSQTQTASIVITESK